MTFILQAIKDSGTDHPTVLYATSPLDPAAQLLHTTPEGGEPSAALIRRRFIFP